MTSWSIDTLSDLRIAVKDALKDGLAGVNVLDYAEGRFLPPVAIVTPDQPFMVPSERIGTWTIRLNVALIVQSGIKAANDLDDLIGKAIQALGNFDIISVSAPDDLTLRAGGQTSTFWGSIITLEFDTFINKEED